MRRERSFSTPRLIGGWGWIGLTLYVIGWDGWVIRHGHETLSSAFARGLECPRRRPFVIATWSLLTIHLFGRFVPRPLNRLDPLAPVVRLVARRIPA